MKFKLLLYLFIGTTIFYSCKSDESETVFVTESDIAGKWNLTDADSEIETSTNLLNQVSVLNSSSRLKESNLQYTFKQSPNQIDIFGSATQVSEITQDGETEVQEFFINQDVKNVGSWSLTDGNKVALGSPIGINNNTSTLNSEAVYEIIEYSENKMIWLFKFDFSQEEDGTFFTLKGDGKLTLER